MTFTLAEKQQQFNAAMDKFEHMPVYVLIGNTVSFVNVTLQAVLVVLAFQRSIPLLNHILTLAVAYVLADFVNGLVHMYMDNNQDYLSPVGPLVASFHLHHRTPLYKRNPIPVVYYHESGASGRIYEVRLHDDLLLTWWVDHAACEVRVIRIESVD